ncbi:MAG: diguanylate cyclase domain-containing protein [Faecalibacterium sp.]
MMKKRISVLAAAVLVALCCLFCPVAAAAESAPKPVRVGYVLFENYQEGGPGEHKRGFGYEYLQKVAYVTGWEYEYVYGSFSELFAMLQKGEIDLMGDISYTEERANTIFYTELPEGQEKYFIYTTANQDRVDPSEPDTLDGCRIGITVNSYQYGLLTDWLSEKGYDCTLVECSGSAQAAEYLKNGDIDAMVMTDMATGSGFVPVVNIGFAEFYFGVSRARPDLLAELDYALREIQTADPYYNSVVYAKYNNSTLANAYLNKQERRWLEEHDNTIRLGYLSSNLPYSDTAEDGSARGLITVLIDTFEKDFDIRIDTTAFTDVREMMRAAKKGSVDLFGPLYGDYWLAEQYGIFNTSAINFTTCILLYQGEYSDSVTQKIAWYPGNAVQRGAATVFYPDAELVPCSSREDSLLAVLDGRASCTLVSAATLNLLRQYKTMDSLNLLELPTTAEVCLGTVRGSSEVLTIANRVIFASSEDLNGAALMENVRTDLAFSLVDFLQENAIAVILLLLGVIVLLIVTFVVYLRMKFQNKELSRQAFRDSLTKVGNRAGYAAKEKELQQAIDANSAPDFALVMMDVNGLKRINDTLGHEYGDRFLCNASRLICRIYDHSPVFRIGGDEFVAVLTGQDYEDRAELLEQLEANNLTCVDREAVDKGGASVAYGMAVYDQTQDRSVSEVLKYADRAMYRCKKAMKRKNAR